MARRDDLDDAPQDERPPVTVTLLKDLKLTSTKIGYRGDVVSVSPGNANLWVRAGCALLGEHKDIKRELTPKQKEAVARGTWVDEDAAKKRR